VSVNRKPRIVGKASGFNLFSEVMPRFLEVRADNGLPLKVPVEVWIAGLMQILNPEQKRTLFEVVGKITGGGVL
jgi:hypothetical protein